MFWTKHASLLAIYTVRTSHIPIYHPFPLDFSRTEKRHVSTYICWAEQCISGKHHNNHSNLTIGFNHWGVMVDLTPVFHIAKSSTVTGNGLYRSRINFVANESAENFQGLPNSGVKPRGDLQGTSPIFIPGLVNIQKAMVNGHL